MLNTELIDRLQAQGRLELGEFERLFATYTAADRDHATAAAYGVARERFGAGLYLWGVVEISNHCARDCYYCGLRNENATLPRYRMTTDEILAACADGYAHGCRTIVLQAGEENASEDDGVDELIWAIRKQFPDVAIALALGEHTRATYQRYYDAGADRYLLRHETADPEHYAALHPRRRTWASRVASLHQLREIGYQVGAGMMVGSPFQGPAQLARDLEFLANFRPEVALVGPYLPAAATPLGDHPAGSMDKVLFTLSLVRLMLPDVLLPVLSSVGSLHPRGREMAVMAGANAVSPSLTPAPYRALYAPFDHRVLSGVEAVEGVERLAARMDAIGYELVSERGDVRRP